MGAVVEKVVAGRPIRFYQLALLDERGGELLVPVDKAQAIGVRRLLGRSEIPKLLNQLKQTDGTAKNWKHRADDNFKLLASGSAFDLAKILGSLTEWSETKPLSAREKLTLERAKKLLVCEISEVMRESKSAVEELVEQALRARKITRVSRIPNYLPTSGLSQGV